LTGVAHLTFGTMNARNIYRRGTLGLVAIEIGKYIMDLIEAQEIK